MAGADKEALVAEIQDLAAKLKPQFDKEKSRVQSEGRPFNGLQWVMGVPDSGKYPAGPAFLPIGTKPSIWSCMLLMSREDIATTIIGSAAFYAIGFSHASKLGVSNGHKLGFWSAVPAVVLGVLAGINKGAYRYAGFMENGNAPLYPGYIENGAPYFLKHKTSDRVADVTPGLHMDGRRQNRSGQ